MTGPEPLYSTGELVDDVSVSGHVDDSNAALFDAAALDRLVQVLIERGYRVVGPTLRDNAIVLDELESAADLPWGWGVEVGPGQYRVRWREDGAAFGHSSGPQSWKQFLHPPRRRLWAGSRDGSATAESDEEVPRYAFLGVRGCDLAAMATLDGVLGQGPFPDNSFVRRHRQVFVVAVNCTEPGGLCFCASMGTGPAAGPGYDLSLTERVDGDAVTYLVDVGTPEGADVLAAIPHRAADGAEIGCARDEVAAAAQRMGRQMPDTDLRGPAGAVTRIAAVGGGGQPVPDVRQLHDGMPDLLLHQHRGHQRSDRSARRTLAAVGVLLRVRFHLRARRRQRAPVRRVPLPALADPQAGQLARPVRHVGLCRLRAVYCLVPHRHRHHRRDEQDGPR